MAKQYMFDYSHFFCNHTVLPPHKACRECMNAERLGPTNGKGVFHPFPGFLANAVAIHSFITHVCWTVFNDQDFTAFPPAIKLPSAGGMGILEWTQTSCLTFQHTTLRFPHTLVTLSSLFSYRC
jgi:hypothetical protein